MVPVHLGAVKPQNVDATLLEKVEPHMKISCVEVFGPVATVQPFVDFKQAIRIVNDVPSFRVDSMPYGGVKESGLGREGIRFAMEDMTEIRLLVMNKLGRL